MRLKAEYPAQQFIAFLLLENELSISRFSKGVNTTTISIVDLAEKILDVNQMIRLPICAADMVHLL